MNRLIPDDIKPVCKEVMEIEEHVWDKLRLEALVLQIPPQRPQWARKGNGMRILEGISPGG